MPRVFEIQSPDGRTFDITAPDNATQEEIDAAVAEVQLSLEDTGEGSAISATGAVGRGFIQSAGSMVEGIGDITGTGGEVNNLQQLGRDIKDQAQRNTGVNPIREDEVGVKVGGVIGQAAEQAAEFLIPASKLGAASKISKGAMAASGLIKGADSGEDIAREFGVDEDPAKRAALMATFGAAEAGAEMLGGFGAEAALSKLIKGELADGGLKAYAKAVIPEFFEEAGTTVAQNAATNVIVGAEDAAAAGKQLPGLMEGSLESGLLGLVGGGVMATPVLFSPAHQSAAKAQGAALAADDPAAAAVVNDAMAGVTARMAAVPLPVVEAAGQTDSTLTDALFTDQPEVPVFTAEDFPDMPQVADWTAPSTATPTLDDFAGTAPPVAASVEAPEAPVAFKPAAADPVLPQEDETAQREYERTMIDTEGRVSETAVVRVHAALRELGVTNAELVINDTGRRDGSIDNGTVRGSFTTVDGKPTAFINRNAVRGDTTVHELVGHGALPSLATSNPGLHAQGLALVENGARPLADAIRGRYARRGVELTPEKFAEEVIATAYGNTSAEFWKQYSNSNAFIRKIQQWAARVSAWVDTNLRSQKIDPNMTVADFAKRVNRQALAGKIKPKAAAGTANSLAAEGTWRIDGVQKGYESDAPDAKIVPKYQNVTITDPTHPFDGSTLSIPLNGRSVPLSDADVQEAVDQKRTQRFSLDDSKVSDNLTTQQSDEQTASRPQTAASPQPEAGVPASGPGAVPGSGELRGGPERVQPPGGPVTPPGSLQGIPGPVNVTGRGLTAFGAFEPARKAAEDYVKSTGRTYTPPKTYTKVQKERATRIANAYEEMEHAPNDPKVKAAFRAMIDETLAQYEFVKATGLKIEPITMEMLESTGDPYAASPRMAVLDVIENNHLWFFPTNFGFGGTESADVDINGNPLLEPTGEILNGHKMVANDVFRVVHDYFGHVKEGVGFRADGEDNAWRSHAAMYSDAARLAMTSETRGQNSWVNFGKFAEFKKTASGAETQYAPQKTGLMPEWTMEGMRDEDFSLDDDGAKPNVRVKRDGGMFTGYIKGRVAGRLSVDTYSKPLSVFKVVTNEGFKRKGVASALYDAAEAAYGPLAPSKVVSDDALKFWQNRRPGIMDSDLRNYSEYLMGKEVSDRDRKGTVKDVGPKGVTALIQGKTEGEVNSQFYTRDVQHLLPPDIYQKVYGDMPVSFSLDEEYMDAVESGNVSKQESLVMKAGKNWMFRGKPESNVWGENFSGVYNHFTKDAKWTVADMEKSAGFGLHLGDYGAALSRKKHLKEEGGAKAVRKGKMHRFFTRLENPLRWADVHFDDVGDFFDMDEVSQKLEDDGFDPPTLTPEQIEAGSKLGTMTELREYLKSLGYDGVMYYNSIEGDNDSAIIFDPNQIKSADAVTRDKAGNVIPLSERFNSDSDDIRYSLDDTDVIKGVSKVSDVHDEDRVGTALLVGKKAGATPQTSNIKGSIVPPELLVKQMEVADYRHMPQDILTETDPVTKRDKMVRWFRDNLLALHDAYSPGVRERATHWYDGARIIASSFADKFNISPRQAAGVLAVLSPQKDWFMNVAQAEQLIDVWNNHRNTVMTEELVRGEIESIIAAGIASEKKKKKAKKGETPLVRKRRQNYNEKLDQDVKDKRRALLEPLIGQTVANIKDDTHQAWAIRVMAQTLHGREYRVISPEGNPMHISTKNDGTSQNNGWGSTSEIKKGVRILKNGSLATISANLGLQHKVRNFYNNIIAPNSPHGDATIDTHAVAAAHLMPFGSSATEVGHNFGSKIPKSGPFGISGLYHAYMDAYKEAADLRGIQPRQMQSITWEAVRQLFPPESRRNEKVIAEAYKSRDNTSSDAARTYILRNGISDPPWAGAGDVGEPAGSPGVLPETGAGSDAGGGLRFRGRSGTDVRGLTTAEPEVDGDEETDYSLDPGNNDVLLTSGVSLNQPDSVIRSIMENHVYQGETMADAYDQARVIYDGNERQGFTFDQHLAELNRLINSTGQYMNMTPGAYYGLLARKLTEQEYSNTSNEAQRAEAIVQNDRLAMVIAAEAARGGQFIKGFDIGLKIANNPRVVLDMQSRLAHFDGSEPRARKFDQEKAAVANTMGTIAADAIKDAPEADIAAEVAQNVNSVIKGEEASAAGAAVIEESGSADIEAAEADAAITLQPWFSRAVSALNEEAQAETAEWLMMLQALDMLTQSEEDFSADISNENISAGAAAMLKKMRDAGMSKAQQIAKLKKDAGSLQKKMKARLSKDLAPDAPAVEADLQAMVVGRLERNLDRLLNGKAKKDKSIKQKITSAISSSLLSKIGYTGVNVSGDMVETLGLLLANQETAANALQDIHTRLEGDETTKGAISREKLKAFMELAIGKEFTTAGGTDLTSAPYGEKQIAAVLRAELRKIDANMTSVVKDAAMIRSTAAKLEAKLRDPARGLTDTLGEEAMDATVAAVLDEYNRSAKERAEAFRKEQAQREADRKVIAEARAAREKRRAEGRADRADTTAELRAAAAESKAKRREFIRQRRRARRNARRELRKANGLPDTLDYDETKALLSQPGEKVVDYLARQFGFDLSGLLGLARESDRLAGIEAMSIKLADALGLTKAQADVFLGKVVGKAMEKMDASRKKKAEARIETSIRNATGRLAREKKPGQPTEAQRLISLAEMGGLSVANVEKVMLNDLGAKEFTPEFKAYLTSLIQKSNDPNLPQSSRDQYTAAYLGAIRSARGVSAISLAGEWIMSNIFFAANTFKVNAFWGGVKALADSAVYIASAPTLVKGPDGQKLTGVRKALLKQMLRGYTKDLRYHSAYILKTGKSKLESDFTTQFANSGFEVLAEFPETEIRAWVKGKPLSPFWAKKIGVLAGANKYVRRIMVGTDILHRTPANEMLKAMKVIKVIAEQGGTLPNTSAAWSKAIDDAMYGGDFQQAKDDAKRQVEEEIALGLTAERERRIRFGEILDAKLGETLGMTEVERAKALDDSIEVAKRWTVANQTEGIMGVLSNSLLSAIRDIPGLQFLLPAVRMPMGAFAQGLDWSPYGFLRERAIRKSGGMSSSVTNYIFNREGTKSGWNLPAGGVSEERAIDLRTKAMIGTSLMTGLLIALMADLEDDEDKAFFYMAGKGPENPAKNKLWRDKGNRPFMVRIGGVALNYQESPAFAPLAVLGAWSDANRYGKPGDANSDKLAYAFIKSMSSFGEAAVLKNLQDVLGSATGGAYTSESAMDGMLKAASRTASVTVFPRLGKEINDILFGQQSTKDQNWAGRIFANVPFVPAINNKPALNWFGEEIHTVRGDAWGEVAPMLAHRISPVLTDDAQMQFVAKMGANPLKTGRLKKDGTEVMDDYELVRDWGTRSGAAVRAWLTPARIAKYEAMRAEDPLAAEADFDQEVREIRDRILKTFKDVQFK